MFLFLLLILFFRKISNIPQNLVIVVTSIPIIVSLVLLPFSHNYDFTKVLVNPLIIDSTISTQYSPQQIFWIILDEHPSLTSMNEVWNDKDTSMRYNLKSLGFTIYDSCRSNYNFTAFSINSTINASMLPVYERQHFDYVDLVSLSKSVNGSSIRSFFIKQGYSIHWLSIFDPHNISIFDPIRRDLHGQTIVTPFIYKFNELINNSNLNNEFANRINNYNNYVVDSLSILLKTLPLNGQHHFTYAHLLMPHWPYVNVRSPQTINSHSNIYETNDSEKYLIYIKYTDSLIIDMLQNSLKYLTLAQKSEMLIILQSDHGYRFLTKGSKEIKWESNFGILNAVLWPQNKKGAFYNGMSSVNTFRILLHDFWGVNISNLKDSSVSFNSMQ